MYKVFVFIFFVTQVTTECPFEEYLLNGICHRCTQCMRRQTKIQECSKNLNRLCQCPPGEYFNKVKYKCQLCSVCRENTKMVQSCQREENTRCIICPRRHHSIGNNSLTCIPINATDNGNGSSCVRNNFMALFLSILLILSFIHC